MAEQRRNPVQWQFTGPAGTVARPAQAYGLRNTEDGKSLAYGKRDNGINLVWDGKNEGSNVTLARRSGSKDPIKHGEFVAIRVKGGKYVRYMTRSLGINLGWSDQLVDEWQIIGSKAGEPVKIGQPVSLRNKVEDDLLVYAVREFGINLRWDKDYQLRGDRTFTQAILDEGIEQAMILAKAAGVPKEVTEVLRPIIRVAVPTP